MIQDDASISVIARATSTSFSARHRRLEPTFWSGPAVDRLAGDGDHTITDEMDEIAVKGLHPVEVRDNNGDQDEAILEIRYRTIRVLPPIGKQKRYPALTLTVIHAENGPAVCLTVKPVGEPDALIGHVRFVARDTKNRKK